MGFLGRRGFRGSSGEKKKGPTVDRDSERSKGKGPKTKKKRVVIGHDGRADEAKNETPGCRGGAQGGGKGKGRDQ